MKFVAMLVLLASCANLPPTLKHDAATCGLDAVKVTAASLLPQVELVLQGGAPDWKAQLDQLKATFGSALLCAVEAAVMDFSSPSNRALMAPASEPDAATRGRTYLQ